MVVTNLLYYHKNNHNNDNNNHDDEVETTKGLSSNLFTIYRIQHPNRKDPFFFLLPSDFITAEDGYKNKKFGASDCGRDRQDV